MVVLRCCLVWLVELVACSVTLCYLFSFDLGWCCFMACLFVGMVWYCSDLLLCVICGLVSFGVVVWLLFRYFGLFVAVCLLRLVVCY